MHEVFSAPNINLVYEATHRQCADIYTKGFHEPGKWYPVCLLVNVFDRHKLAHILTSFTVHKFEKEQKDILANFAELKPEKKRTTHDIYEYTAAPSVQRRGGITTITTPTQTASDNCDELNLGFDDLPLTPRG